MGQDNNVVVNQVVKGLIENPTGAKYLVINNPTAQYMGIKVIATARIADVIDNYIFFNKQYGVFGNYVKAHNYNLSAEQALNSKITLMIDYDNLYKEI